MLKLDQNLKTQILAVLGCAQWLGTQKMPMLLPAIGIVQSQMKEATVEQLRAANMLVKSTREYIGITVHPHDDPVWVTWHDAA